MDGYVLSSLWLFLGTPPSLLAWQAVVVGRTFHRDAPTRLPVPPFPPEHNEVKVDNAYLRMEDARRFLSSSRLLFSS